MAAAAPSSILSMIQAVERRHDKPFLLLKLCLFILEEALSLETCVSSLALGSLSCKSFWERRGLRFLASVEEEGKRKGCEGLWGVNP